MSIYSEARRRTVERAQQLEKVERPKCFLKAYGVSARSAHDCFYFDCPRRDGCEIKKTFTK